MNLAILIAVAALVGGNAADKCSGFYRIPSDAGEVLKDDVDFPDQLALDRDTNTLFFSYQLSNYEDDFSQSMYVNLKDGTSGPIRGVTDGFAHAYDSQHQIVYITGDNGIYKFDYESKTAVNLNLNITGSNIWQMFYKNGLYFTIYGEGSFVYKDGKFERVPELKKSKAMLNMLMAVDEDGSLVLAHNGALTRVKNGQFVALGYYSVNCFNTYANGELYFSTPTAIYSISGNVVKKVVSIPNIYGFVIEGYRQLIYATDKSVVRVTLTEDMCGDDTKIENETANNIQN